MSPKLIVIFGFLSAALAVLGISSLLFDLFIRQRAQVRARLDEEFRRDNGRVAERVALFKDLKQIATESARQKPSLWKRFSRTVEQSGLPVTAERLLGIACATGWLSAVLAAVVSRNLWLGAVSFVAGSAVPVGWVLATRQRRIERLRVLLPDAFELMSRAIRAGQTVTSAFQVVAENFTGPLAEEFSYCYEQQSLGLPLPVALGNLARRSGVVEMQMFAVTLSVQRQSGGNPVEMLNGLADVIRKRIKLRGRIAALTGEGRLQALVLLALPPLMFAALFVLNREYVQVLLDHPEVLGGVILAQGCGALWIRKIIRFDY